MQDNSKKKIIKALEEIKEEIEKDFKDSFIGHTEKMCESFCKMDKKDQLREMGQMQSALASMEHIVEIIQNMSDDERKEQMKKSPALLEIAHNTACYLELGLIFGYTTKKED